MNVIRIEYTSNMDVREQLSALLYEALTLLEQRNSTITTQESVVPRQAVSEVLPASKKPEESAPKPTKLRGRPRTPTSGLPLAASSPDEPAKPAVSLAPVTAMFGPPTPAKLVESPASATTMFDPPAPSKSLASSDNSGPSYEAMKDALQKVAAARPEDENQMAGLNRATAILDKFGYQKVKNVKPEHFAGIIAECGMFSVGT